MTFWGELHMVKSQNKTTKRPQGDHLAPDWLGDGINPITGWKSAIKTNRRKYYGEWGELLNDFD